MEIVNLNLIPGEAFPVCHASQFDVNRTIRFNLFNGSSVYSIPEGATVTVELKKPDNHYMSSELTTGQTTYVDLITTKQMTAIPGKTVGEIKIENNDTIIGTCNFYMIVEESPINHGVTSSDAYEKLKAQVIEIVQEILG